MRARSRKKLRELDNIKKKEIEGIAEYINVAFQVRCSLGRIGCQDGFLECQVANTRARALLFIVLLFYSRCNFVCGWLMGTSIIRMDANKMSI